MNTLDRVFNWIGENPLSTLGGLAGLTWAWVRFFEWVL